MNSRKLREKFLVYFEERGHKVLPSASLIPADPTVLFTTAGMQRLSPYLSGEKDVMGDFGSRHLASCQKCFRTGDIEEIGDDTHHTFFEMLGNWSVGFDEKRGYFKEGAIKLAWDFVIKELKLDKDKIWITIFEGNKDIPKDEESRKIWLGLGIPKKRILEFGMKDNLWGPVKEVGPCGPNTELHHDRGEKFGCGSKKCGPNCPNCDRFVEIWNLVFMEYLKEEKGFKKLPATNVDTGAGFERLLAILGGKNSAYETDLFKDIISEIEKISKKKYSDNKENFRVLADHVRGAVFLAGEGIVPSNLERGYILRRLLRRSLCIAKALGFPEKSLVSVAQRAIDSYKDIYPELQSNQADILTIFEKEEEKFGKALEVGIKEACCVVEKGDITGKEAFKIYETYGCPLEYIEKVAKDKGRKMVDKEGFEKARLKHQKVSKAGAEKKFGGVGKGATYEATKLHTATHLLHQALREVLGEDVRQMGSDITSERLRFDFSYPAKLTEEQKKKVEEIVNRKIKEGLEVKREETDYTKAVASGALAFFKEKYPDRVSVYSVGDFSKEICAGPHVKNTSELGEFKIVKEKSASAGVRRIKAVLK